LLPSVTTIIHAALPEPEALRIWRLRPTAAADTRKAAIVGSLCHYRILSKLAVRAIPFPDTPLSEYPADARNRADLAEMMWDDLDLTIGYPRHVEKTIINRSSKYAGQLDLLAPISSESRKIDDMMTLADLKTSKQIRKSHCLQIGGYYEALGRTPDRGMIITLHTYEYGNHYLQPTFKILSRDSMDQMADEFLKLVDIYYDQGMYAASLAEYEAETAMKAAMTA